MISALHPAAVLCLRASAAVFFQSHKKSALWWTALNARRIAGFANRRALRRLLRRIRAQLVDFVVLFGFTTPGTRVFMDSPVLGVSSRRLAVRPSVALGAAGQRHRGWCDWLTQARALVECADLVASRIPFRLRDFVVFYAALAGALAWGLA